MRGTRGPTTRVSEHQLTPYTRIRAASRVRPTHLLGWHRGGADAGTAGGRLAGSRPAGLRSPATRSRGRRRDPRAAPVRPPPPDAPPGRARCALALAPRTSGQHGAPGLVALPLGTGAADPAAPAWLSDWAGAFALACTPACQARCGPFRLPSMAALIASAGMARM
jgi:hypothetical protein